MTKKTHDQFLEELCYRLNRVGLDNKKVQWIIKDGIWQKENSYSRFSLCDLIVSYYDGRTYPIELKGTFEKRTKATSQIMQGHRFIEQVLGRQSEYGLFVVYSDKDYKHRMIRLENGRYC